MSEEKKQPITNQKVSRRSILKWTGALAAAAAVGAVAEYGASELMKPVPPPPTPPVSFKPPLSPEIAQRVDAIKQQLIDRHAGETIVYTVDPQVGGAMGDDIIIRSRVKDGIIKAMETDDTINPGDAREEVDLNTLNKGMIQARSSWPVARAWRAAVYNPDRILYPLKIAGKRAEGKYVRISWTEALDTIVAKSKETKEKYGPCSIYSWSLDSLFGCGVQAWGENSWSGFMLAQWLMAGNAASDHYGVPTQDMQSQSEVFKSKLVVFWGRNPVEVEQGSWPYCLVRAKEAGIPIICIDPRYTTSAEALNAQWIPIRPGTDLAMALAIADVLYKENLYDEGYVAKWVEPTGAVKFRDYVTGTEDGIEKTPEWAEKLCGVPAETIREFARLYAKSRPTMLFFGWAAARSMSTNVSRVITYLQVLTGNYTVAGGGSPWWAGYGKNNAAGPIPSVSWGRKSPWKVPCLFNGPVKFMDAVLLRDKVSSGEITREEYNETVGNQRDNAVIPNIQILVQADVAGRLGANKRASAMRKVNFSWGWGGGGMNDSRLYYDIVLPQTETTRFEENSGMVGLSRGFANHFVYCKPAIKPVGESRPQEWAYIMLAKRLGLDKDYNPRLADVLGVDEWDADKWAAANDQLWKAAYEAWMKREDVAFRNPPSWEEFNNKPVYRYEAIHDLGPFGNSVAAGKNPFAGNREQVGAGPDSGKIEIYAKFLEDPTKVANAVLDICHVMSNYDRCCFGKPGPAVTPLPKWFEDIYGTFHDSGVKQYPLVVTTTQTLYRHHSKAAGNPLLIGDCYRHACWISVADAKARGIKDGDLVRVYSSVGEMIIPAYVTSRTIPGVVSVSHHNYYYPSSVKTDLMPDGIDRGGSGNFLIEDNQPGKMIVGPTLDAGLCQVEKL